MKPDSGPRAQHSCLVLIKRWQPNWANIRQDQCLQISGRPCRESTCNINASFSKKDQYLQIYPCISTAAIFINICGKVWICRNPAVTFRRGGDRVDEAWAPGELFSCSPHHPPPCQSAPFNSIIQLLFKSSDSVTVLSQNQWSPTISNERQAGEVEKPLALLSTIFHLNIIMSVLV